MSESKTETETTPQTDGQVDPRQSHSSSQGVPARRTKGVETITEKRAKI